MLVKISDMVRVWLDKADDTTLRNKLQEYDVCRQDLSPRDSEVRASLAQAIRVELARRKEEINVQGLG